MPMGLNSERSAYVAANLRPETKDALIAAAKEAEKSVSAFVSDLIEAKLTELGYNLEAWRAAIDAHLLERPLPFEPVSTCPECGGKIFHHSEDFAKQAEKFGLLCINCNATKGHPDDATVHHDVHGQEGKPAEPAA
jgi:hypothetical protein